MPDPSPVAEADVLLLESTYGDRLHEVDDNGDRLANIVTDTAGRAASSSFRRSRSAASRKSCTG